MKIRKNNKRENKNLIKLIAVVCIGILFSGGPAYGDEDLEELKRLLLEQERQIEERQQDTEAGNKGYIYTGNMDKTKAEEVVEIAKPVPVLVPEGEVEAVKPALVSSEQQQERYLCRQAWSLYKEGYLDEARQKAEEVLVLNPLHIPMKRLILMITDKKSRYAAEDNVVTDKEKMLDVDRAWLLPGRKGERETVIEQRPAAKTRQRLIMEERARQIIPEINFTDAQIRDVLKYLSDISGINIVIDEDLFPKTAPGDRVPGKVEVSEGNADLAQPFSAPGGMVSDRITISLTNIPLLEALKYILAVKGLKYRIDEYAIVVSTPERLSSVEMETRYYHLAAGVGIFTEFVKKVEEEQEGEGIAKGLKEESKISIKDVLEQSGVPFPPGSKVFLDKRTGTLIVRNTPQNLRLVEEVLRMLDVTPFQVEIEARFVEVMENTAQELGLEWMITNDYFFGNDNQLRWDSKTADSRYGQFTEAPGTGGLTHGLRYLDDYKSSASDPYKYSPEGNILSISGILSKPEFRMIIHALNQDGYSNVLSSPKVTTLNNQQAQIEIVKEIIYPEEFELTPATTNDYGTIVTQPVVTPVSWTTRNIGIILNVTPSVGADKKTINLTLSPEVSRFDRWEDYGITAASGDNWNAISIKQPIFFTQTVETNVVIHDGETVVLGGLIEEVLVSTEDKIPLLGDIPLLGRLFRSNTETTQKKNLLIFVTANLLTPTGERIRQPAEDQEAARQVSLLEGKK